MPRERWRVREGKSAAVALFTESFHLVDGELDRFIMVHGGKEEKDLK